jgi:hypothetical protein
MNEKKKEIIIQLQEILHTYKPATIVLPRNLPRKRKLVNPAAAARGKRAKHTEEGGEEAGEKNTAIALMTTKEQWWNAVAGIIAMAGCT